MTDYRIEKDSLGEIRVPKDALYAAQTQRAVQNFPISGLRPWAAFVLEYGNHQTRGCRSASRTWYAGCESGWRYHTGGG
jgi:hypothetical protein